MVLLTLKNRVRAGPAGVLLLGLHDFPDLRLRHLPNSTTATTAKVKHAQTTSYGTSIFYHFYNLYMTQP